MARTPRPWLHPTPGRVLRWGGLLLGACLAGVLPAGADEGASPPPGAGTSPQDSAPQDIAPPQPPLPPPIGPDGRLLLPLEGTSVEVPAPVPGMITHVPPAYIGHEGSAQDGVVSQPLMPGTAIPDALGVAPAEQGAIRPRPPEPPPPGSGRTGWDASPFSLGLDAPVALPRPDPFPLIDIPLRHDNRIVSMDGRLTPVKRVPQWVDTIDRHTIRTWRPYDIGFMARHHPNVLVRDGGNPFLELPVIRGLGGDRVRILTDGVWPVSQALGGQGGTLSLWDPEATERVEIFHGPGAYLRAIDAPGGMINIVSRRPRMHGTWGADFGVRSAYDSATKKFRNRVEADVGAGRLAALVGATYTTVGDRDLPTGTLTPTDYDQMAVDLAADYFLTPRARIGITGHYVKASNLNTPFATGTAFAEPSYERFYLALTMTDLSAGQFFRGGQMSLSLDGFFQDDDRSLLNTAAGIGSQDDITRFNYKLEGQINLLRGHETWAELSAGYAHLDRTETLLCVPRAPGAAPKPGELAPGATAAEIDQCDPVSRSFEAEELLISALLEDRLHCHWFDTYLGLRADYWWIDDTRFSHSDSRFFFGAAAGLTRHLNERVSVYGNGSFGWRRPSLFERTATEVLDGRVVFANENLDPELHGNAEVGLKAAFKNRWSIQAAAFAHLIDDTIAPVDLAGPPPSQLLMNQGEVWLYGGEVSSAWRPIWTKEGLELFGSAGITRSSDTSLVSHVPLHYRGGVRYSVPAPRGYRVRRWRAEFAVHGAERWSDGPRSDGSYLTADLVVGAGIDLGRGRQASVNAGITNLLDETYTPPPSHPAGRGAFVLRRNRD